MRSIQLAFWFMAKSFINSIKRAWKVYAVILAVFALIFAVIYFIDGSSDSDSNSDDNQNISEDIGNDDYVIDENLDFDVNDDGAFFYEAGVKYEVSELLFRAIASVIVIGFITVGIVNGSKYGAAIFEMPDVNLLFPAPMMPQAVLLFKMVCQIGAALIGSIYILYQIPNLINNTPLTILGAVGIFIGYVLLVLLSKFISVFTYVVLSDHEKIKAFILKYGYAIIALPFIMAFVCHFVFGMGYYASVNAVFGKRTCAFIPFWGWLSNYATDVAFGNYAFAVLFLVLTIIGMSVLVWAAWKFPCDFYEDAFEHAVEMDTFNKQIAEGTSFDVKHDGKRQAKKWDKKRNNTITFDGYEGASVFMAKTLFIRKRMYPLGGLWSSACGWYFFVSLGCGIFLHFIADSQSSLMMLVIPTALCTVSMFLRSFFNPLQLELSQNFIYMIPESPFETLGYGMAGQILDGAIDLAPAGIIIAILSENIGYGISAYLLMLSMHIFFGMTALLVNLVISSYLPVLLSKALQVIIRFIPFLPVALAFSLGLLSGNIYITIMLIVAVNIAASLLAFIPCPFFLHKGKKDY